MKKALLILGLISATVIVIGIIYFRYFFALVQPALNKESQAWVDDTIPKIIATWNVDEAIRDSSPELLQITSKDELKALFTTLSSKLGGLKQYNGSTGEAGVEISNGHKITTAEYIARADFTNGSGEISIRCIKENSEWKILEFHVNVQSV
jgi:hypothetical protein